ncbi:DUF1565 domain-containing protein, partial [bacterium]|nr:DUF1565 domain-containing protein [bacterium]
MRRTGMIVFALIALVFLATGICLAVAERDYYVDPINGYDGNRGVNPRHPLKTITRAAHVGWDYYPNIHLAEGLYSEASGEVFPIAFNHPPSLLGSSMDNTVIYSDQSPRIMAVKEGRWSVCTISDLTFYTSDADPSDEGDTPIAAPATGDVALDLDYSPPFQIHRSLFLVNIEPWELDLGYMAYLLLTDSTFIGASPDAAIRFDVDGSNYPEVSIENCSFNHIGLTLDTKSRYPMPSEVIGCTFNNTHLHLGAYECRLWFCVFDEFSSIRSYWGWTGVLNSCLPFEPEEDGGTLSVSRCIPARPLLVSGPLGDCYLSNEESGQWVSSPCIDIGPIGSGDWPPEGSTTRTDGVPDQLPYDIGYHYPSVPPPAPAIWVETDRQDYAAGDEMTVAVGYENRGVKVEGAMYIA